MNPRKYADLAIMGVILVFLMSGCANYGKFRPVSGLAEEMTVLELQRKWDDYIIYSADWRSVGWAGAVIFDPREDDKTLVCEKWMKVEDQETLSRIIASIDAKHYHPRLYQILGPNDQLYGYMYLGPRNVRGFAKATGSNTLWISDIQPRILGVP